MNSLFLNCGHFSPQKMVSRSKLELVSIVSPSSMHAFISAQDGATFQMQKND